MSDNQWISMVIPCVTTNHLTEDKLAEVMSVQSEDCDFASHELACSSVLSKTGSNALSTILKDVIDMEYEVEERKNLQEALLCDPSPFEDLKTKVSTSSHQAYPHTSVNPESDVDTSEPLDSDWGANIQIRDIVDMVQTRDDKYRKELQRNAENQNKTQAMPCTSDAAPLKENVWDLNMRLVQRLGKGQRVTVLENPTTMSQIVEKQYLSKPEDREVEVLKAMNHPSIPTLYDTMVQGNRTILRMEYCGEPLARHVEKYFKMGSYVQETFICNILEQMMDLLKYLEHAKVMHQNISGETICLQRTRKGLLVKLVGFGDVLTYQDLVPQSGIQSTAALVGTALEPSTVTLSTPQSRIQSTAALGGTVLEPRTITLSAPQSGIQSTAALGVTAPEPMTVTLSAAQRWETSIGSEEASRLSCQADMVACGRVALLMVLGPAHLNTLKESVKDLREILDKNFPKRNSEDLKDLILKMIDVSPMTGLKPAEGLNIIQNKFCQDVIQLSDSDGAIELSDSDEVIELSDNDEDMELSGKDDGAVESNTNRVTALAQIPVATQLQTPFSFQKNCDSKDLPAITTPRDVTVGTVGNSYDRPDDVISVNPGSRLYSEPYKIPWPESTQLQADKGTLNKLRSRVTGNQGSRDKPYIRRQTKFTNLPNLHKLIN